MEKITRLLLYGVSVVFTVVLFQPAWAQETGGVATGITQILTVKCKNKNTGQKVYIRLPVGVEWSCEAAGLGVNAGDRISIDIEALAQGLIPDAPSNIETRAGDTTVILNWPPLPDADSYNIYGNTDPEFKPNRVSLLANTVTPNYVQGGLSNDTTYYFYVTAINGYGESAVSEQLSATPQAFVHDFIVGCAVAGCHDGSGSVTPKPAYHPLTTNVCEACHFYPRWIPLVSPFDHSQTADNCTACHSLPGGHCSVLAPGGEECSQCHLTTNWVNATAPCAPPLPPPLPSPPPGSMGGMGGMGGGTPPPPAPTPVPPPTPTPLPVPSPSPIPAPPPPPPPPFGGIGGTAP